MQQTNEKARVLLVDDEPEILASLNGLLRREFTLFTAHSGKEALEIIRQETVHVIMTDQRMPEMTGAELLSKAQVCSADSIRIIFTGYADIKSVIDAVNNGRLYRYITKPWDPDELVEVLREAASEYSRRQRQAKLFADLHIYFEDCVKRAEQSSEDSMFRELSRTKDLQSRIREEIQGTLQANKKST